MYWVTIGIMENKMETTHHLNVVVHLTLVVLQHSLAGDSA